MDLIVNTDGASRGNPGPSALAYVIADGEGRVLEERGAYIGQATNNVAEYRAVIEALRAARRLGARRVRLRSDSELLIRQVRGEYRIKAPQLAALAGELQELMEGFERVDFEHVPREANTRADRLANEALDRAQRQPVGGTPSEPPAVAAASPDAARAAAAADGTDPAGESAHGEACRVRVRYGETDQMGVVYYANYFDWFTDARTELMRRRGIAYAVLERRGIYLPVREAHCEYLRPARYDQLIVVYARVTRLTRVRLDFAYEVRLLAEAGEDEPAATRLGTLLATGWTRHAFIDGTGRPFDVARRHPELWERLQRAAAPDLGGGASED